MYLCYSFLIGPFLRFLRKTELGMEITINGKSREIAPPYSVEALLSELFPASAKGIAIAINQSVVPRSDWPDHLLRPHDQVTLITATQGG